MKKPTTAILISSLILLQAISLMRMGEIQKDLQATRNQLANLQSSQSSHINNIYANIESLLKRQSSIIDSYDYSLGSVDSSNLTIPVTFNLSPKESKDDTTVMLYVSGKNTAMAKNGVSYTATIPVNIFDTIDAKIVLTDNGIQRTETLEINESLRDHVLPFVHARFEGESGGNYSRIGDELSGEYTRKGHLVMEVKPAQNNTIEKASLVVEIDGKIISEEPIKIEGSWNNIDFDNKFTLSAGEKLTMSIMATDSFGLIHKTILDKFELDENAHPIAIDDWMWMGEVIILDKEGNVLYEPYLYEPYPNKVY